MRSRLLRAPRRAPRRTPAEPDRWLDAGDGVRLAAWVLEPRAPGPEPATVVLAHGWTLAAAAWDRAVADLTRARPDVRVLRYD